MQKRGLVFLGQWTADGDPLFNYLVDTTRLKGANIDSGMFGEAYCRIQGSAADANSDPGYVGKVQYVDPVNGFLYVTPAFGAAPKNAATTNGYEVWMFDIRPDDVDRAIDRALIGKCTEGWQLKPLSVFTAIENWRTAAYSTSLGGMGVSATAAAGAMSFPAEWFDQSMVVTGGGGGNTNGYIASPSFYVVGSANQTFKVFGWVSSQSGTAKIRVRDITNGADISIGTPVTFAFRGWTFFVLQGVVPATCGEIQIWAGQTGASDISEWAGIGLMMQNVPGYTLERVRNEHEVGLVYPIGPNLTSLDFMRRPGPVRGVHRERSGSAVRLWFDRPQVTAGYGVYYEELKHYAPFVTTEGQTGVSANSDYSTKTGRYNGDLGVTPCHVSYAEAAAVVELLKDRQADPDLKRIYDTAFTALEYLEGEFGADEKIIEEHTATASVAGIRRRI